MSARSRGPVQAIVAVTLALSGLSLVSCRTGSLIPGPDPQAGTAVVAPAAPQEIVQFPNAKDSLKFLAFGDFGTGEPAQYELARQMAELHKRLPFELVILLGDNIYGSERPQEMEKKFTIPYKPLLDAKVKFKGALGNHDSRQQANLEHFDMQKKFYYSFKAPRQNVRFFALESTYMDLPQTQWVENELKGSNDDWKIMFFHHAMYSSARGHGSTMALRQTLEPLFIRYNVSLVFNGHDHTYERVKPQGGVVYFVVGSAGKLRPGDLNRRSPFLASGFDSDLAFFAGEIDGDNMVFQAISRTGKVVDSGIIVRRKEKTQ